MMARSPAKRIVGTMLFFVAALVVIAFVVLLYANSINDEEVPYVDQVKQVALVAAIALGVIAILLFVMLFTRRLERKAQVAEDAEVFFIPEEQPSAAPSGEVSVYDLRKVPLTKAAWGVAEEGGKHQTFYFPRNVEAGVYINDYMPIDKTRTLKLRTLMGGPYDPAYVLETTHRAKREARAPAPAPEAPAAAPTRQGLVLQQVEPEAPVAKTQDLTYFDYPGDNHAVEDLEGIGSVYGDRLRSAGVHTTARLTYETSGPLSEKLGLPTRTVDQWKMMAELVKVKGIGPQYAEALVRAGIEGIAELKRRSPVKVADQINAYLDTLDINVIGHKITEKRVEGWQDAAKPLRRIKLKVPDQ